jgi:hypothetical protein
VHGKGSISPNQIADSGRQGKPGSSGRPFIGSTWREHHGVLQAVQCQDPKGRRQHHPGDYHRVQGPVIHVYYENSARVRPAEKSGRQGSGVPQKDKVGKITRKQLTEIAQKKMADLNAADLEGAVKIIEGTARSMGVVVQG